MNIFRIVLPSFFKSSKKQYIQIAEKIAGTNKQYENINPIAPSAINYTANTLLTFSFEYNNSTVVIKIATIIIPTERYENP